MMQTNRIDLGFVEDLFFYRSAGCDVRRDWNWYNNITLRQDLGSYKAGQQFTSAQLNVRTRELEVYTTYSTGPVKRFRMRLVVEEEIDEEFGC